MTIVDWQACRGRIQSGGKNTNSKIAKQAALGFVKRTLERCHQFESTGKSCFSEPLFKDMFLAASPQMSMVRLIDDLEAESTKLRSSSFSREGRTGIFFITYLNKCSDLFLFFILAVLCMIILTKISDGLTLLSPILSSQKKILQQRRQKILLAKIESSLD